MHILLKKLSKTDMNWLQDNAKKSCLIWYTLKGKLEVSEYIWLLIVGYEVNPATTL